MTDPQTLSLGGAIDGSHLNPPRRPAPTVARIVHYQPADTNMEEPWAAIITEVHDVQGTVRLKIFNPLGTAEEFMNPERPGLYDYADTPTPGHWNWPPRA